MNAQEQQQQNDSEQMHLTIQQAQAAVDIGETLERLHKNKDFQILILNGYLKEHPARLSHLLSDPNFQGKKKRNSVLNEIGAVGYFLDYLRTTQMKYQQAAEAIRVNEEELAKLEEESV